MIKNERKVIDLAGMLKIVDSCYICRLGLAEGNRIAIVPMTFGYTFLDGKFTFYFKGDLEEERLALIRNAEEIDFQMDSAHCMLPMGNGEYTMFYNHGEGYGKPVFLEDEEEKKKAMKHLLAHYLPGEDEAFADISWKETCVFKLDVIKLHCKVSK